jgi:hypothetical protein
VKKDYDIEHSFLSYFLPNLQLNIGKKKYLKTAKIIDESLILAIVLRNYSTKPSYIFQIKRYIDYNTKQLDTNLKRKKKNSDSL